MSTFNTACWETTFIILLLISNFIYFHKYLYAFKLKYCYYLELIIITIII